MSLAAAQFSNNVISGAEMLAAIARYRNRITVRTARHGETFPATWELGFDALGAIDPAWLWIAERAGKPLGAILASEAHGTAIIWRVVAPGPDSAAVTRRLLHAFLRDLRDRGLRGYIAMLNRQIPTQDALARIIERAGGHESATANLVIMAGPIPKESITCHS